MTSRERVLIALSHKEPDRVPIFNTFTPEVSRKLSEIYGVEGYELDKKLGHDCMLVELGIFNGFYQDFSKEYYTCRWGVKWKRVSGKFSTYMEIDEPPIKDIRDVYSYNPPQVDGESYYNELLSVCKNYGKEKAIIGGSISIFENSWYLRGFQNFLYDLVTNEKEVNYLLDKVTDYNRQLGFKIIDTGVDILYTGDDFGMQSGLLISYNMWRKFFYDRWAGLFEDFKRRNPNILIAYHSDGNILPLIDDLIGIGVDILNPIQPECMSPTLLKKEYGQKVSFWGTIDVQHTLSFGESSDVEKEVIDRLKNIAVGGGLILGSTHNVQYSERAIENLLTFYNVIKKYGNYPIEPSI